MTTPTRQLDDREAHQALPADVDGSQGTADSSPGQDTADQMAAWLEEAERTHACELVSCQACQDFRTNVTGGAEHPCPECQREQYTAWLLADPQRAAGLVFAVGEDGRLFRVVLGASTGDEVVSFTVKPVDPTTNHGDECAAAVLLAPVDGGAVEWATLCDVRLQHAAGQTLMVCDGFS